jgi:acetyltransferase-like isoleucine patch superfamily enzyme
MTGREAAKALAHGAATAVIVPALVSYRLRALVLGRDRALEGSTQALALLPGVLGQYLRRAFLAQTLDHCARSATIEFGTIFSQAGVRIGDRAYVGPRCHLGLVSVEADVLIAAGVHIPSGPSTHGIADLSVPIRDQPGERRRVTIGEGAWIGSAAVVLADVGARTVVGAGAVVTTPLPPHVIAGGVPARVIRTRERAANAHDSPSAALVGAVPHESRSAR